MKPEDGTPPLYLAGQTASGKSAVAAELALRLAPAEIVNADAFQLYRGMEILTAAPSDGERAAVPHHLYGVLDPSESCDAARFAERAIEAIAEVGRRALPLVVGGSGLYLKAITHGLAPTPPGDPALREELDALDLDELVAQYRRLDPAGAEQTNLKNRRYVTRNLEITLLAGRPASDLKREWRESRPAIRAVYLDRSRDDVYDRINRRTAAMFDAGVVDEVAALGSLSDTAAKAIGIREIRSLLAGETDRDACIQEIAQATRRYAKRQEFWFRRETDFVRVPVATGDEPRTVADRIIDEILPSRDDPRPVSSEPSK